MLESLINFKLIQKKPYLIFVWAIIVASVSVISSAHVQSLPSVSPGFFSVLLTIIPSAYFLTVLIRKEEKIEEKEIQKYHRKTFWGRHEKDIMILLFFFFGLAMAFGIWGFALPDEFFDVQLTKINQIRGGITGAQTVALSTFDLIFRNNLQVTLLSFIFSFIFGAGAIFIIVWNASVLGVYIGELSKALWQIPIISLSFLPHGIPEIAGYIAAALAGGLLSAGILRKNTFRVLSIVAFDSAMLMVLAILLILFGAGIEAFL